MFINKESKIFNKGLEDFRGFNEEEWRFLNGNLKTPNKFKNPYTG